MWIWMFYLFTHVFLYYHNIVEFLCNILECGSDTRTGKGDANYTHLNQKRLSYYAIILLKSNISRESMCINKVEIYFRFDNYWKKNWLPSIQLHMCTNIKLIVILLFTLLFIWYMLFNDGFGYLISLISLCSDNI